MGWQGIRRRVESVIWGGIGAGGCGFLGHAFLYAGDVLGCKDQGPLNGGK